jgi:protein tyrosine/serine phosphatase
MSETNPTIPQTVVEPSGNNFHRVDLYLFRSARPPSQEMIAEWNRYVASVTPNRSGIHTILYLDNDYDHEEWQDREQLWAEALGIKFVLKPMDNMERPTADEVRERLAMVRALTEKKHPVLIHCKYGSDRTGILAAAYRMKVQGWSKEEAVKEMYEYGHSAVLGSQMLFNWDSVLDEL